MRVRKDFTRLEGDKSARLVVIAAEGFETENIYFEAMKTSLRAANVHVEVLRRDSDGDKQDALKRGPLLCPEQESTLLRQQSLFRVMAFTTSGRCCSLRS